MAEQEHYDPEVEAWFNGYEAFQSGEDETENPYEDLTQCHDEWERGFDQARQEDQKGE